MRDMHTLMLNAFNMFHSKVMVFEFFGSNYSNLKTRKEITYYFVLCRTWNNLILSIIIY